MKSRYTLVIVDMQPEFPAARNLETQRKVVAEIRAARKLNCKIVVLEYADHGTTVWAVRKALAGYSMAKYVTKEEDDGSREAFLATHLRSKFRLCGVNINYCVVETANGLVRKLPKAAVQIVIGACNAHHENTKPEWRREYIQHAKRQGHYRIRFVRAVAA